MALGAIPRSYYRAVDSFCTSSSARTTFVVNRDGTVFAAVGGVSPEENVARALELVRTLLSAKVKGALLRW